MSSGYEAEGVLTRLNVNIVPEQAAYLSEKKAAGMSATEMLRRAIMVAHFLETEVQAGRRIEVVDKKCGVTREIVFL